MGPATPTTKPWARLLVLAAMAALAVTAFTGRAEAAPPVKAKVKHGVLTVTGSRAADTIVLRLRAGSPGTLEVVAGRTFAFDRGRFDRIVVDAGAGDDDVRVDEANGDFADTEGTTLYGEQGNDTLLGGSGAQVLDGGAGDDAADGNHGDDLAVLGAGDDTFVWDPGDGSDIVEGDRGVDRLVFNGSAGAERFEASADEGRLRLLRDLGSIVMDVAGTERVELRTLAGADHTVVNDLAGTGVDLIDVDLGADGEADTVTTRGTLGDDDVHVARAGGDVRVSGLAAEVRIARDEPQDRLIVDTLAGSDRVSVDGSDAEDVIDVAAGPAPEQVGVRGAAAPLDVTGAEALTVNALAGADTIAAGDGLSGLALRLDGGAGQDRIAGGKGDETLVGGDGPRRGRRQRRCRHGLPRRRRRHVRLGSRRRQRPRRGRGGA